MIRRHHPFFFHLFIFTEFQWQIDLVYYFDELFNLFGFSIWFLCTKKHKWLKVENVRQCVKFVMYGKYKSERKERKEQKHLINKKRDKQAKELKLKRKRYYGISFGPYNLKPLK